VRPFYARRAQKTPDPTSLALLVSAPEMELASLLITAVLIGPVFAAARLAAIALSGLVAGAVLGRTTNGAATEPDTRAAPAGFRAGLRFALAETVEHTGPWIVFGLLAAALLEPYLPADAFSALPAAALVPALALAGMLLPMCASGATPLLAVLLHKGLPVGAALAFAVVAAASSLRTTRLLAECHGPRFAARHVALLLLLATGIGFAANALLPGRAEPPLHAAAAAGSSPMALACLGFLIAVLLVALLRRGPRSLLLELLHDDWRLTA
jgi:uncharacterized protein